MSVHVFPSSRIADRRDPEPPVRGRDSLELWLVVGIAAAPAAQILLYVSALIGR